MDSVVHFEVPADDLARAKKFYTESFGWELQDMPEMSYVMATTFKKGQPVSDMPAINGGMPKRGVLTAPSFSINVANIDAAMEKVKAAGGVIVPGKTAVGKMWFMEYCKDSEGNVLSLWQNAA